MCQDVCVVYFGLVWVVGVFIFVFFIERFSIFGYIDVGDQQELVIVIYIEVIVFVVL